MGRGSVPGRIACLALGLFGFTARASAQSSLPTEYQVKAAFLYNFARFVEWPGGAFADSTAPVVLGLLGGDPFGSQIDAMVAGKTVNGRRLEVRRLRSTDDLRSCHILFVGVREESHVPRLLESVRGLPVLTVGDFEPFALRGGVLNFVLREDRVRFEINLAAGERAGLKISSKLLSLATLVQESGSR